jgi:hypothetical protein
MTFCKQNIFNERFNKINYKAEDSDEYQELALNLDYGIKDFDFYGSPDLPIFLSTGQEITIWDLEKVIIKSKF